MVFHSYSGEAYDLYGHARARRTFGIHLGPFIMNMKVNDCINARFKQLIGCLKVKAVGYIDIGDDSRLPFPATI